MELLDISRQWRRVRSVSKNLRSPPGPSPADCVHTHLFSRTIEPVDPSSPDWIPAIVGCEPFWTETMSGVGVQTDLLSLFGLPSTRDGLIQVWESVRGIPFPNSVRLSSRHGMDAEQGQPGNLLKFCEITYPTGGSRFFRVATLYQSVI
jgi:hypothetical protein